MVGFHIAGHICSIQICTEATGLTVCHSDSLEQKSSNLQLPLRGLFYWTRSHIYINVYYAYNNYHFGHVAPNIWHYEYLIRLKKMEKKDS